MKLENTQGNLIIGEGVEISGAIVCPGTVTLDGTLQGTLSAAQLHVGPSGRINGEVVAGAAVVYGEVKPSLTCRGKLVICSTGKVTGTVQFQQLEVELGGQLVGKIHSTSEPAALELTEVTLLPNPQ
ncbi:polymer-forming cytoskeletal protein [Malikia sp.]|uniref:bactofilin family protein n=1 Tax=Malikia sp. TaxID=2070706 RepID=UPI002634FED6|nr:polymer-forming cytoskeletal protein [Malikia sp.]MDD2729267.1 polymer-forming cytoskeletal protein [Malikia sp.]